MQRKQHSSSILHSPFLNVSIALLPSVPDTGQTKGHFFQLNIHSQGFVHTESSPWSPSLLSTLVLPVEILPIPTKHNLMPPNGNNVVSFALLLIVPIPFMHIL